MSDPDVVLVRQTVKPGKVERLREWMAEVRAREDEAVETLADEGMLTETAFLRETDGGGYLFSYMEAEDVAAALATFEDSDHDVDERHRAVMDEVLVEGAAVEHERLYHLTNPGR